MLSSKPKWGGGSTGSELDGSFNRLDEMEDLRPLGHGVEVGTGPRPASMAGDGGAGTPSGGALPSMRIGVKTDVVVETSERLVYNDRLY